MNHTTKYIIMKFILSSILVGLLIASCKKESRTERPLTADSIVADTIKVDTNASSMPTKSDSMRTADSISLQKIKDTAKATKKKAIKK